jgi:hypothetical protein
VKVVVKAMACLYNGITVGRHCLLQEIPDLLCMRPFIEPFIVTCLQIGYRCHRVISYRAVLAILGGVMGTEKVSGVEGLEIPKERQIPEHPDGVDEVINCGVVGNIRAVTAVAETEMEKQELPIGSQHHGVKKGDSKSTCCSIEADVLNITAVPDKHESIGGEAQLEEKPYRYNEAELSQAKRQVSECLSHSRRSVSKETPLGNVSNHSSHAMDGNLHYLGYRG